MQALNLSIYLSCFSKYHEAILILCKTCHSYDAEPDEEEQSELDRILAATFGKHRRIAGLVTK